MKNRSLWGRMLSAFAKDGDTTPEDLEQAAKLNPKAEDEMPVPEKEDAEKKDKEAALEERLKRIEDAIAAIPESTPAPAKTEDEEPDEEDTSSEEREEDALDSLENELESGEEARDEETVTVDPEAINRANESEANDEDLIPCDENEDTKAAKDAALDAIRALRPVVAALPTKQQRKKAADSLAALIRGNLPDNGYGVLMQARKNGHANAKDRAMDDRELGKMIRDKYNPHYRKN